MTLRLKSVVPNRKVVGRAALNDSGFICAVYYPVSVTENNSKCIALYCCGSTNILNMPYTKFGDINIYEGDEIVFSR